MTLTFYFRPGCHLCDDMWQQLQELRKERVFELKSVNVDDNSELQARFGTLIPVLASGDKVLCHYYLDPVALVNGLEGRDTV